MADTSIIKSKKSYNPQSGDRYNNFVLVSFHERRKSQVRWLCLCDCGKMGIYILDNLRRDHTQSCGCVRKIKSTHRMTTHGDSKGRATEYSCWLNMRNRCYYKPHKDYSNYGGRGIVVCDRWRNSYQDFLGDMGRKPSSDHSIDRIDVNGSYEPSNCRWTMINEQARNKRRAFFVNYTNEKRLLKDVCKERAVSYHMVHGRLKHGWELERALHEPSSRHIHT